MRKFVPRTLRFLRLILFKKIIYVRCETRLGVLFDRHTRLFSARWFFARIQKPLKKVFNSSVDFIDDVHQTHIDLRNVEVVESTDRHYNGSIQYDGSGIPFRMNVCRDTTEKHITIFHEIGHLIDLVGVGIQGQFESRTASGLFTTLLQLAKGTPEIVKINNMLASKVIQIGGNTLPLPPNTLHHLTYLIDPAEIVARSYAQYIVEKSRSKKLGKMLENRKKDNKFGEQWSEKNFEPLLLEWDNILNSIGWHVKK
jgi:hypothetical protein